MITGIPLAGLRLRDRLTRMLRRLAWTPRITWQRLRLLQSSTIARRLAVYNLMALLLLGGFVYIFDSKREDLSRQVALTHERQAQLIASLAAVEWRVALQNGTGSLSFHIGIALPAGMQMAVISPDRRVLSYAAGPPYQVSSQWHDLLQRIGLADPRPAQGSADTDFADAAFRQQSALGAGDADFAAALQGQTVTRESEAGQLTVFATFTPVVVDGGVRAVLATRSVTGQIDLAVQRAHWRLIALLAVAGLVSVQISLLLAGAIVRPLSALANAAGTGGFDAERPAPAERVEFPQMDGRDDEIGTLSRSLRGMMAALYRQLEHNDQFAADVTHELKNPLASLRSAVDAIATADRPETRKRLMEIISHDVNRLDRLVSDIARASRLERDMVHDAEEVFDLGRTLAQLTDHLKHEAKAQDIDLIVDLPEGPTLIRGLESRLAQVFVNLFSNAASFCEAGDAIRIWSRQRDNRLLVVFEDTGPGIPESALDKIFQRFYSERPAEQFGDHSGLGLAICKQIVEAHGGVIWAENIRPGAADAVSEPLGARFVVGLPLD